MTIGYEYTISQSHFQNLIRYNPKDIFGTCQCCSRGLWQGLVQGDCKCLTNPSCLDNLNDTLSSVVWTT